MESNRRKIAAYQDWMPNQQSCEIHLAIGKCRIGGKAAVARYQVVVSPNAEYEPHIDAETSMNASIAAQLLLANPQRPGVYAPESYLDPETYLAECKKRKFEVLSKTTLQDV